jgi:hypothetical protein
MHEQKGARRVHSFDFQDASDSAQRRCQVNSGWPVTTEFKNAARGGEQGLALQSARAAGNVITQECVTKIID